MEAEFEVVKHAASKETHSAEEFWVSKRTNQKQMLKRCTQRLENGKEKKRKERKSRGFGVLMLRCRE
jgi:hypothetical protein